MEKKNNNLASQTTTFYPNGPQTVTACTLAPKLPKPLKNAIVDKISPQSYQMSFFN